MAAHQEMLLGEGWFEVGGRIVAGCGRRAFLGMHEARIRETSMRLPKNRDELSIALHLGAYMHPFAAAFGLGAAGSFAAWARQPGPAWVPLASWVGLGVLVVTVEVILVWRGLYLEKYLPAIRRFNQRGWHEELVEFRSHSLCERRMIQRAADATGHGDACRAFLESSRPSLDWRTWKGRASESLTRFRQSRRHKSGDGDA